MKTFDFTFDLDHILSIFVFFLLTQVGLAQPCPGNLLVNPDASDGLNGWTITSQSGAGWSAGAGVTSGFFRTSYGSCPETTATNRKHQVVDLVASGFDTDYLDTEPTINVGERVVSAFLNTFCDAYNGQGWDNYYVRYEIWDANNNVLAAYNSGTPTNPQLVGRDFINENVTFTNYGKGARYVYFEHGGSDSGFWGGWFGAYFRDCQVNVDFDCAGSITCPDDVTVSSLSDFMVPPVAVASDAASCCSNPLLSYTDTYTDDDTCSPSIIREWRGTTNGGVSICRQKIEVEFDCGIVCPLNKCVDMGSELDPSVLGQARAGYGCMTSFLSYTDTQQSECDGVDQVLRIWKANFSGSPDCYRTCSQLITFNDGIAPVLASCPEDIVVSSSCNAVHWAEPTASDNCLRVSLRSDYAPSSTFDEGTTTVTYTASDACGNTAECSFNVTVVQAMVSDCPEDMVMDYDPAGISWSLPAYTEMCDACPPASSISGYKHVGSYGGSDYYLSRRSYDYATSRSKAIAAGGYLASITSKEENDFLSSAVYSTAFIGLSDASSEGNFHWHSGEDMSYSNWFMNQPNNYLGNQHYVELLSSGEWNDADDKAKYSIMEKPCSNINQISGPSAGSVIMPGTYEVAYTIEDGCGYAACCSFMLTVSENGQGSLSKVEVTEDAWLDLDSKSTPEPSINVMPEWKQSDFTELVVYPNPVSDLLSIKGLNDHAYMVYDQNGNLLINMDKRTEINVQDFNPGLYILRAEDGRIIRFIKM